MLPFLSNYSFLELQDATYRCIQTKQAEKTSVLKVMSYDLLFTNPGAHRNLKNWPILQRPERQAFLGSSSKNCLRLSGHTWMTIPGVLLG